MAKFTLKPTVKFEMHMTLNESEARALEALAGYGVDDFIKFFYEHMGEHYLKPHEAGLRELLSSVRANVGPQLATMDKVRNVAGLE